MASIDMIFLEGFPCTNSYVTGPAKRSAKRGATVFPNFQVRHVITHHVLTYCLKIENSFKNSTIWHHNFSHV